MASDLIHTHAAKHKREREKEGEEKRVKLTIVHRMEPRWRYLKIQYPRRRNSSLFCCRMVKLSWQTRSFTEIRVE